MRAGLLIVGFLVIGLTVSGNNKTGKSKKDKNKKAKTEKQSDSRFHTLDGRIKPGTVVLVTMKDGSTTEAQVMYSKGKNNYWLNEKGGGNFGMCKRKFFVIKNQIETGIYKVN